MKKSTQPPVVLSARQTNVNLSSKSKRKPTYANVSVPANDFSFDHLIQFISTFLEELKSILNPLLIVLTKVINKFSLPHYHSIMLLLYNLIYFNTLINVSIY